MCSKVFFIVQANVMLLLICICLADDGTPGALCECRCCWDIGNGRSECRSSARALLLKSSDVCNRDCTPNFCAKRFPQECVVGNAKMRSMCVYRNGMRFWLLILFLMALVALFVIAILKKDQTPNVLLLPRKRDAFPHQSEQYGACAVPASRAPFLVTPMEPGVLVADANAMHRPSNRDPYPPI